MGERDRITPYREGGSIEERIDEIVQTGADVHFEMMGEDTATLWIGDRLFNVFAEKGKLVVCASES